MNDTVYLTPNGRFLKTVEIVAERLPSKYKKSEVLELGLFGSKSKLHYAGIKEAALFVSNPTKKGCYISQLLFSFTKVKFDRKEVGRIKNKDLLLSINLYKRNPHTFIPYQPLFKSIQTHLLKANSKKLVVDLTSSSILFPPEGCFVAVEFLGYYDEGVFVPINFNDSDIRNQFAPDLSGKHNRKRSFYRKTFSNEWSAVIVDIDGFYNFNFGLKILSQNK